MSLHQSIIESIEQIDAAFFSGDQFHDESNLEEIMDYLCRWEREAKRIEESIEQEKFERCP